MAYRHKKRMAQIPVSFLLGVKIEPCKWVSTRENKGRIEVQSKRATLRSAPTQTVR